LTICTSLSAKFAGTCVKKVMAGLVRLSSRPWFINDEENGSSDADEEEVVDGSKKADLHDKEVEEQIRSLKSLLTQTIDAVHNR
jgi:hypothetical protein